MKTYLYLSTAIISVSLAAGGEAWAQCVSTQDCATLGYTESSCPNGGVKCPFGSKWACFPEPDKTADCVIGALYYADGTCSNDYISSKKLLGIVIYEKSANQNGWVMAHIAIATGIIWSTEYVDIPGLTNYDTYPTPPTDIQASCTNTDKITAQDDSSKYPAAWAAKNYTEGGKTWCLPSGGLLNTALNNQTNLTKFNASVYKIQASAGAGAATILGNLSNGAEYVWSSSEYSSRNAWIFYVDENGSSGMTYGDKYYGNYDFVRPVFAF